MIIVTGASGFIGSCLVSFLNKKGIEDLILVDEFNREDKLANIEGKKYIEKVNRGLFDTWFKDNASSIDIDFKTSKIIAPITVASTIESIL